MITFTKIKHPKSIYRKVSEVYILKVSQIHMTFIYFFSKHTRSSTQQNLIRTANLSSPMEYYEVFYL